MTLRIGVVGATGLVGREILTILAERGIEDVEVRALASRSSLGTDVSYGDTKTLVTEDLANVDPEDFDIALFAASAEVADAYAFRFAAAGALVIDNSSLFRMRDDVPLIVPEVNAEALDMAEDKLMVANPNCVVAQMVVALNPLHQAAGIKRVACATYQSTSGAGRDAMDELFNQTRAVFVGDPIEPQHFSKRIAFNVIPQIGSFGADGSTGEEQKMVEETVKIMGAPIAVQPMCVRVPVFVGHAIAAHVELESALDVETARDVMREAPGLLLIDKPEDQTYITPYEAVGDYATFVSRVRRDPTVEHGLSLWIVSDNLRKGAALNAVQIAELALERGLVRRD
jgi:aspartate-semialdehyde dehydrogenase